MLDPSPFLRKVIQNTPMIIVLITIGNTNIKGRYEEKKKRIAYKITITNELFNKRDRFTC